MDTNLVKTVKMYGPSISDPSRIVNRDVPENDVQAYKAVGYQLGSINEPPPAKEEIKEIEAPVAPKMMGASALKKKGSK